MASCVNVQLLIGIGSDPTVEIVNWMDIKDHFGSLIDNATWSESSKALSIRVTPASMSNVVRFLIDEYITARFGSYQAAVFAKALV